MYTTIYYTKLNPITNEINGFYIPDLHGQELCDNIIKECGIIVNGGLHQYLLQNHCRIKNLENINPELVYDLSDVDLFEEVIPEMPDVPDEPTQEDRITMLEEENAMLLLDSAKKDATIASLEIDMADLMLEVAMIRSLSEV